MLSDDQFSSSNEEHTYVEISRVNTEDVSILKYLPKPRQILSGHTFDQPLISTCLYQQKLAELPEYLKTYSSDLSFQTKEQLQQHQCINKNKSHSFAVKLNKIESLAQQHRAHIQKISSVLAKNNQEEIKGWKGTLWSIYGNRKPSYSRFGFNAKRSNYANVIINTNDVFFPCQSQFRGKTLSENKPIQQNRQLPGDTVNFESHFQGGNLLYAYRAMDDKIETYDLILQNDTNTRGHNQWFYFRVSNKKISNRIRFNIINFVKNSSFFSYGIKPLIFSEQAYLNNKSQWVRSGQKISYYANKIRRQSVAKTYYTASFQYYFQKKETVYFAPVYPYNYSHLKVYLKQVNKKYQSYLLKASSQFVNKSAFFSIKVLSETVAKNKTYVITIGSDSKSKQNPSNTIIWIFGRQHPAQTTSSFMIQSIISYLLQLYSSNHHQYSQILKNIVFKIVPMLNVDGVIHGNTRAQISGLDPNRMWRKPKRQLCPQILSLKKAISQQKNKVSLVLDLHSHSKNLGCFFYGNQLIYDPKSIREYPVYISSLDERFCLKNCRFRGGYQTTARMVLFKQLQISRVYTVECSLVGYMKNNRIKQFTIKDYHQMGKTLIKGHLDMQMFKNEKKELQIKQQLLQQLKQAQDAESARSESSLSEDEYEQIKAFKKKKYKKIRLCLKKDKSCTLQKLPKRKHERIRTENDQLFPKYSNQNSVINFLKPKRTCGMPLLSPGHTQIREPMSQITNNKLKCIKPSSMTFKKKALKIPQISLKNQHYQIDNQSKQIDFKLNNIKLSQIDKKHQGIQVNNTSEISDRQNHNKLLCVIGSSLEDQHICVNSNEVCLQVRPHLLKDAQKNYKKKSCKQKMPKIMTYLCSNLIGVSKQQSILPNKTRVRRIK